MSCQACKANDLISPLPFSPRSAWHHNPALPPGVGGTPDGTTPSAGSPPTSAASSETGSKGGLLQPENVTKVQQRDEFLQTGHASVCQTHRTDLFELWYPPSPLHVKVTIEPMYKSDQHITPVHRCSGPTSLLVIGNLPSSPDSWST